MARAYSEVLKSAKAHDPSCHIEGVLLSPMAGPGQEVILGLIRDPSFGPVVMFGLGGIFVEVLGDVSFGVAPLSGRDIDRMIKGLRGYPALTGIRGGQPKDIEALKDLLGRISRIALENPEIDEIDLNPVIVHEKGLSIVDARIILGPAE